MGTTKVASWRRQPEARPRRGQCGKGQQTEVLVLHLLPPTPKEAGVPALAVALSSGEVQPTAALNSAQEQVKAQAGWPQPSPQQPVLQPAFPTLPAHNKPVSSPGSSPLSLQLCAWASPGSRHPPALQTGSTSCPPIRLAGECVWGDPFNHQVFEQSRRPLRLRQEREPQWGKVDSGVLIFR